MSVIPAFVIPTTESARNFLASESKGKKLFHFAECRRKSAPLNLPVILPLCHSEQT
jgi:hypothetical protein